MRTAKIGPDLRLEALTRHLITILFRNTKLVQHSSGNNMALSQIFS